MVVQPHDDDAGAILVIEDDPQVRGLVTRILRRDHACIVESQDGESAIALLEGGERRFDLAIVDWSLPGIGGHELLERLHRIAPEMPVLVSTGHLLGRTELAAPNVIGSLEKPFPLQRLRELVRGVMRRPRRGLVPPVPPRVPGAN